MKMSVEFIINYLDMEGKIAPSDFSKFQEWLEAHPDLSQSGHLRWFLNDSGAKDESKQTLIRAILDWDKKNADEMSRLIQAGAHTTASFNESLRNYTVTKQYEYRHSAMQWFVLTLLCIGLGVIFSAVMLPTSDALSKALEVMIVLFYMTGILTFYNGLLNFKKGSLSKCETEARNMLCEASGRAAQKRIAELEEMSQDWTTLYKVITEWKNGKNKEEVDIIN